MRRGLAGALVVLFTLASGSSWAAAVAPATPVPPAAPPLESPLGRFGLNFGGGPAFPLGDGTHHYDVGWNVAVGGQFNFNARFAVQLEYLYSQYGLKSNLFNSGSVIGDHTMEDFDLNGIVTLLPRSSRVNVYLIGGPGIYFRWIMISRIDGVTAIPYCDPFLLACFTGAVPVASVVGTRTVTSFGLNGGVGVTFMLADPTRLYVEARYHYMWGPTLDTPTGTFHANSQYIPLVAGIRF
ncbi:MAG: outer membrane beta-barrel protein [Deltaproteobacteria bacterium]|nr:outer membrane beta-barrel protein [Deltaproteobacteria bacterium]